MGKDDDEGGGKRSVRNVLGREGRVRGEGGKRRVRIGKVA